jgi:hypothetical protein
VRARATLRPVAALAILALPGTAAAEALAPCPSEGPLAISLFEGDVGVPFRACPRTELAVGATGSALIDTPAFFGTLDGALRAGGSYRYAAAGELFASAELLRWRFVQNATLTGTGLGIGWLSTGATHQVGDFGAARLAAGARLSMQLGRGLYSSAWPMYAEFGAAGQWRIAPQVSAHAHLGVIAGAAWSAGPAGARAGLGARTGGAWNLGRLALLLDGGGIFAYGAAVEGIDLAPGLRARIWRDVAGELAVAIPLAGATRTDLAAALSVRWRP